MITIVDYGVGNVASIVNMLKKAGTSAVVTADKECLMQAKVIILPGVGSFDNAMARLKELNLLDTLSYLVLDKKIPFLGICLGMQILFEKSEEGSQKGLGWLKGYVRKFDFSNLDSANNLKVPHMGWNVVQPVNSVDLYNNIDGEIRFYFVHSYHVVCDKKNILATANYGYDFVCSVHQENIWGAQFHPEKSHRFGVQFFKNFLRAIESA